MRIKLPILIGAVGLTIAGIAVAAQGNSIFTSSANPLSTIGEMISTSLWDTDASDSKPVAADTTGKHFNIAATFGKMLSNTFSSLPISQSTYVPSEHFEMPDYNPIDSNQTVGDFGNSENGNVIDGSSGNSFVSGGGSNWGTVPSKGSVSSSGGVLFFNFPGISFNGGPGGSYGTGLGSTLIPATWTLSSNGTLTYSVTGLSISPAPEPGEWMLMLLGFGLVGFIGTLRKQKIACN
jgi:hypothetical protein